MGVLFDPRAGLDLRPFTVDLAGEAYHIRAAPASVWLEAWGTYGVGRVMAAMLHEPAERYRYYRGLSRGTVTGPAALEASRLLWGAAAGTDWWTADNLAVQSVNWAGVGGELYAQGLRPDAVPLGVWLAASWRVILASVKREDRAAVEAEVTMRPAGYDTTDAQLPATIGEMIT